MGKKPRDRSAEAARRAERRNAYLKDKCCADCQATERRLYMMRKDGEPLHIDSRSFWNRPTEYIEKMMPELVVLCATCRYRREQEVGRRHKAGHGNYTMYLRGCRCAKCKAYGVTMRERQSESKKRSRLTAQPATLIKCTFCGLGTTMRPSRRCKVCRPPGTQGTNRCKKRTKLPIPIGRCPGVAYFGTCTMAKYHAPKP